MRLFGVSGAQLPMSAFSRRSVITSQRDQGCRTRACAASWSSEPLLRVAPLTLASGVPAIFGSIPVRLGRTPVCHVCWLASLRAQGAHSNISFLQFF